MQEAEAGKQYQDDGEHDRDLVNQPHPTPLDVHLGEDIAEVTSGVLFDVRAVEGRVGGADRVEQRDVGWLQWRCDAVLPKGW